MKPSSDRRLPSSDTSTLKTVTGLALLLRPAQQADIAAVLQIEGRAHSHPWRQASFENCFSSRHQFWVVEREQGKNIAAYAITSHGGGEAELLNVSVDPDYQRQGIGAKLLAFMVSLAEPVADSLFLEVRFSNCSAIALYESLGFNEVGIRPNYYPAEKKGREDALILAKSLSATNT